MILETLIRVVRIENKKKLEKPKMEEMKQEEKTEEQEENDFLSLKANEELSPLINFGLTANKDVFYLIKKTLINGKTVKCIFFLYRKL